MWHAYSSNPLPVNCIYVYLSYKVLQFLEPMDHPDWDRKAANI